MSGQCSAKVPHAAHTYGGRPMLYCAGIEQDEHGIWKRCPQCGRDNSVATCERLGWKCPNCGDIYDKSRAAQPVGTAKPESEKEAEL